MGFSRQEYWSGVPLPSPNFYIGVSNPPGVGVHVCCERDINYRGIYIYIWLYGICTVYEKITLSLHYTLALHS